MMMAWPTIRPPDRGGEPSPPSTRPESWPSTTPWRQARPSEGRCCGGRGCTPPTSPSGARPVTPPAWRRWPRAAARPSAPPSRSRWRSCAAATPASRRSWPAPAWPWRSRESARALGAALRERGLRPEVEAVIDEHFDELVAVTSTKTACALLGASRATRYRRRQPPVLGPPPPRPSPPNRLSEAERQHVLTLLRSPEYC